MQTITTKEIRKDLSGFLQRIQKGDTFTVLYRSRPVVNIGAIETKSQTFVPGSPEAVKRSLDAVAAARKRVGVVLDPNKSIKELYRETKSL